MLLLFNLLTWGQSTPLENEQNSLTRVGFTFESGVLISLSFLIKTVKNESIDPLHKWRLHLNNNTYTSLASHS